MWLCRYYCMTIPPDRLRNAWKKKIELTQGCYMLRANAGRRTQKKTQLYSYLPPISQTIKERRTRYVGYCLKIKTNT